MNENKKEMNIYGKNLRFLTRLWFNVWENKERLFNTVKHIFLNHKLLKNTN